MENAIQILNNAFAEIKALGFQPNITLKNPQYMISLENIPEVPEAPVVEETPIESLEVTPEA